MTSKNGPVSMTTAKLVLMVIDRHGRGREAWLSYDTLAAEVGRSARTVKRAVEALEAISVLAVTFKRSPSGAVCNHYRIVWNELALLRRTRVNCQEPDRSDISDRPPRFSGDSIAPPNRGKSDILHPSTDVRSDTTVTESTRREEKNISRQAVEIFSLDFSGLNLAKPEDVGLAIDRLEKIVPADHVAQAAAVAVRKGRNPSALFVHLLTRGWGKYVPADEDLLTAKKTLKILNGW
jgi:hypothetical protein